MNINNIIVFICTVITSVNMSLDFSLIYRKLLKGTHHDNFVFIKHPHKLLGYTALIHTVYRYTRFLCTGSMFDYKPYESFFIVPHIVLSLSSFLFPVRESRVFTNQIMWRELQLHNIIFSTRSCCILLFHCFYGDIKWYEPNLYIDYFKFGVIMSHHLCADIVSHYYSKGNTMRDMAWDNPNARSTIVMKYAADRFYALSQFGATTFLMFSKTLHMETAYAILFAIQISAFLMTLRLKGMISNNMWHFVYSLALLVPSYVIIQGYGNECTMYTLLFYIWRVILRQNKYIGWCLVLGVKTYVMYR